ncbi:hypothetical protein LTR96_011186 [Exophiala xenobiotica]|nr:hypothetical protein LTR92_010768 [Exophiala xenobiotica]KAK5202509.1 hypothetical protein LTR41_011742 [Exophiala xenobiotica]KAK5214837.1 hypothetical protein LTR72_012053 [Exophiala xenobiotica]KAK5221590.1 hypothetical protein LTR47_010830 [Exophiala xenobiotica]KAK5247798.1 hypothetical protein LTS06_007101 [Exophiala xenobiotica]
MSDTSSNPPLKPVKATNGTPGPSDREHEKPSSQDRVERVPTGGEGYMAMIRSFHEGPPEQVDSACQSSTQQVHHTETSAQAAGSGTVETQMSGPTSLWDLRLPTNIANEDQNDHSAASIRSSKALSAQDGLEQIDTSTCYTWDSLRTLSF